MTSSREDGRKVTHDFEPTAASAAEARQFLRDATSAIELDQHAILLLGSELVTNAIRHAGTPFRVEVDVHDDRVRISVTDANTELPVVKPFDLEAESGMGMSIIDQMSKAWGASTSESGKTVWFETPLE